MSRFDIICVFMGVYTVGGQSEAVKEGDIEAFYLISLSLSVYEQGNHGRGHTLRLFSMLAWNYVTAWPINKDCRW